MELSIIIPNYNNSNKLTKCINSCYCQGLDKNDFEVIVVDDKSTDNSIGRIEKLKDRYNFKLIKKSENGGVESARFEGLRVAKGEYFCFIDSDDWYKKNTLSQILKIAKGGNYDMVEFRARRAISLYNISIPIHDIPQNYSGEIIISDLNNDFYASYFGKAMLSAWTTNKIIKRDVFDVANINMSGLRIWEDAYFNIALFPYVKRIFVSSICAYNYRYGGVTSSINFNLFYDLKKLYQIRLNYIEKFGLSDKFAYYAAGETKNVFKELLILLICHKDYSDDFILNFIAESLQDPMWDTIFTNATIKEFKDKEFSDAMISKNAENVLSVCKKRMSEISLSLRLKRLFNHFFSKLGK